MSLPCINFFLLRQRFNPISPSIFSVSFRPGEGVTGQDYKRLWNLCQHHLIEMKLCMSNVIYAAKCGFSCCSSLGDSRHKDTPFRKLVIEFGLLHPENRFNLKNWSFYIQNHSLHPKIDLPCQFQQFSSKGKLVHFKNFSTSRWQKSSSNPPGSLTLSLVGFL